MRRDHLQVLASLRKGNHQQKEEKQIPHPAKTAGFGMTR
jgi:hypothetical protein